MNRPLIGLLPFLAMVSCSEPESKLTTINSIPNADAGNDVTQSADAPVTLDGGGSYDEDGDSIAYHWSFDSLPETSNMLDSDDAFPGNGTTTATSSFQADETGTYIVQLIVEDINGAMSTPDYVVITITDGQSAIADAGADQAGVEGSMMTLDGTGSYDPMGRDLAYNWQFHATPSSSALTALTGWDTANPTFEADAGGVYIVSLIVDNGVAQSSPDTMVARISSADPQSPVALAGDDMEVEDCLATELDGSGSYDANGDDLSFQWSVQSQPDDSAVSNASFEDRSAAVTTFFPDVAGNYILSLAVFDGTSWSSPDILNVDAAEREANADPIVDAGNPKTSDAGEAECAEDGYTYDCESCEDLTVSLGDDASVTDSDGDPLTYEWIVLSGEAEIDDSSSLVTTVTLMDVEPTEPEACEDNEYEFQLSVTDCTGSTETDTVVFTASCCGVTATR
jgi:hypothetical protein